MAKNLLRGHEKYRRRAFSGGREFLQLLASEGQSPDALFVGCSDSRVVPELLTNSSPGALFVVRNIANVIPPLEHADASVGAAIDYAVGHLAVPHVIVCGHTGCGGVKAAIDGVDHIRELPSLREWLTGTIQPAIDRARAQGAPADPDAFWRRVVEEHVLMQLTNLLSFPVVAERVANGSLLLHGWVFDIHAVGLSVYDDEAAKFRPANEVIRA